MDNTESTKVSAPAPERLKPELAKKSFFQDLTKNQKIALIATTSIILILLIVSIVAAVYISNQNKNKTSNSEQTSITPTPTVEETATPTSEVTPTPTDAPSKVGNYTVQYTGKPVLLPKLDIWRVLTPDEEPGPGGNFPSFDNTDNDSVIDYYLVGKIVGGGHDGYELIYAFKPRTLLTGEDKTGKQEVEYPLIRKGNEIVVFNYKSFRNENFEAYDKTWFNKNIKTDPDVSLDISLNFDDIKDSKIKFKENLTYTSNVISDANLKKSLVLGNNVQTYLSNDIADTGVYVKTASGFYKRYFYQPSLMLVKDYQEKPQITWTTDKVYTNTYDYSYVGFAVCGVSDNIGVTDVPMAKLKQTGKTSTGLPVYEYINSAEDSFLNKIYKEDYIEGEMNKGNTIKEDDVKAFTLEQYKKYHPVFYWKDEFGRLIQFESNEFMLVGGCAKPAVYLYPESSINVNVKLALRGPLTFSIPNYNPNNGWNVTANPNGTITSTGENYDYLFWEGKFDNFKPNTSLGWSIKTSQVENFLNQK